MLGHLVEVVSLTLLCAVAFFPILKTVCFDQVGVGWLWLGYVLELLHDHWLSLLLLLLLLAVEFLN